MSKTTLSSFPQLVPWHNLRLEYYNKFQVSIWYVWGVGTTLNGSVQFSSVAQLCLTLCDPMDKACSNSCPNSNSNSLCRWCHPTISPSVIPFSSFLQSFPIRVFSNESVLCIRWPKNWSFSFNISPPSEYSGLISFRVDCFDLLVVQGTLKSLLQQQSSKASILWCSAFFMVQLSYPYMTTGKTIALTRQTFVGKVISPLFNKSNFIFQIETNISF